MLHGRAGSVEDERCGSLKPLRTISLQRERKGIDSAPGAVYVLNDGVIVRFFTMEPVVWNTRAVVLCNHYGSCRCTESKNSKAFFFNLDDV